MTAAHDGFVARAVASLSGDPRLDGLLLAGSAIQGDGDGKGGGKGGGELDRWSDVDLVVIVDPRHEAAVAADRAGIAATLGPLLACFTGEHVGEPRLLICLFGDPLLHVDLKFVTVDDLAHRVETPRLLWDRHGTLGTALSRGTAAWPDRPPQWFEDRVWIWLHYGAARLGRGELFETVDMLAHLRAHILGPLVARRAGQRQRGVRRIEALAPELGPELAQRLAATAPPPDRAACAGALHATADLYRALRADDPPPAPAREAEGAVLAYLAAVIAGAA